MLATWHISRGLLVTHRDCDGHRLPDHVYRRKVHMSRTTVETGFLEKRLPLKVGQEADSDERDALEGMLDYLELSEFILANELLDRSLSSTLHWKSIDRRTSNLMG